MIEFNIRVARDGTGASSQSVRVGSPCMSTDGLGCEIELILEGDVHILHGDDPVEALANVATFLQVYRARPGAAWRVVLEHEDVQDAGDASATRFEFSQILDFLRQAESGVPIKDLCTRHGFSESRFLAWRAQRALADPAPPAPDAVPDA